MRSLTMSKSSKSAMIPWDKPGLFQNSVPERATSGDITPFRTRVRLILRGAVLLAVLGIVWLIYRPALTAGALYMDDDFYLGAHETRHPSWSSVKTIFGEVFTPSVVKGYYQPLALVSIMADFLDPAAATNLRPFHRTSLALHMLNVLLVAVLLYLLFGNWMISCALGLLYGLHPLNADVVLWVAERKAVLSTFFALLSLVFYVLYTRHRDWKRYGASLLMYVFAVLSKPAAVPLAVLLLVTDYWPLKRLSWQSVLEKMPFFIVCIVSVVITVISQARSFDAGATAIMKWYYAPFVVAYSVGLYLFKTVWPAGIVYDYPFPQPFSAANPEVALSIMGTVAAIVLIAFSATRTRALLAGGLFFFIAISPALGIVSFTSSVVSNRFMYLPMVGLLMPLAWALNRLWNLERRRLITLGIRIAMVSAGSILAIGSACITRNYESHWRDSQTLLTYYLSKSPHDWKLHTRMGNEWIDRNKYDSAITEFANAIRLHPAWAENHLNLGRALFTMGRFDEAQLAFNAALGLTPNDWRCHVLMGVTLARLDNFETGRKELSIAARLAPKEAEVHYHVAGILAQQGKKDKAIMEYRETLRLNPHYWEARKALDTMTVPGQR
jgi:protein O-mannosyl-transferase